MTFVKDEVVAQVQECIDTNVANGISCKKVAELCELSEEGDNNFGALVVGHLIKSGAVVGYETRKGSGIVPEGTPAAKSAAKEGSKAALKKELDQLKAQLATKAA